MIQKYDEKSTGKRKSKVPGTPRFKIQCSAEDMETLDPDSQKKYCFGVGMLL